MTKSGQYYSYCLCWTADGCSLHPQPTTTSTSNTNKIGSIANHHHSDLPLALDPFSSHGISHTMSPTDITIATSTAKAPSTSPSTATASDTAANVTTSITKRMGKNRRGTRGKGSLAEAKQRPTAASAPTQSGAPRVSKSAAALAKKESTARKKEAAATRRREAAADKAKNKAAREGEKLEKLRQQLAEQEEKQPRATATNQTTTPNPPNFLNQHPLHRSKQTPLRPQSMSKQRPPTSVSTSVATRFKIHRMRRFKRMWRSMQPM